MKEFLKPLLNENFDMIKFYHNDKNVMTAHAFRYNNFGIKQEGSKLGDLYDIIIFSEKPFKMPERFKAVLSSPVHYISQMIDIGFLGIVAKATTTSEEMMEQTFSELNIFMERYAQTIQVNGETK